MGPYNAFMETIRKGVPQLHDVPKVTSNGAEFVSNIKRQCRGGGNSGAVRLEGWFPQGDDTDYASLQVVQCAAQQEKPLTKRRKRGASVLGEEVIVLSGFQL